MEAYDMPIEDLGLSVRIYNCLKRSNIIRVNDILKMTGLELLSIRNLGMKSYRELHRQLITYGFMSVIEPVGPFDSTNPFVEDA